MYKTSASSTVSVTSFLSSDMKFRFWMSGYFLTCCCNQFCLPVCTTEHTVHTKRLHLSWFFVIFCTSYIFCFCSSVNVQILLSLSTTLFRVPCSCVMCTIWLPAKGRERRVQSLSAGCTCISLCWTRGHVHYILERNMQSLKTSKAVQIKYKREKKEASTWSEWRYNHR